MTTWIHATRLCHLLPPEAYFSASHHERELACIFRPGWHCVASLDDVPGQGDFITRDLLGLPLLIRNADGKPRVFLNVCAHRHTLLTHALRGSAPRMKCQYHGWEYDSEGAVCKIPDASCFVPIKKGVERLKAYRTETVGKLIWVSLVDDGPSLRDHLGERAWTMAEEAFSGRMRQGVSLALEHPCNWKIPIENVLESYHVPLLHDNVLARHPEIFRFFRGKPGDPSRERHELGERFTAVHDVLGADSAAYRSLVHHFRPEATFEFVHLHAFPDVLFGRTALLSFLQVVTPVSATTSRSMVRIFLDLGQAQGSALERLVAPLADLLAEQLFMQLLREDSPIYPDVQRGMESSPHAGVLGSREERIHQFHSYVVSTCGLTVPVPRAPSSPP